MFQKLEAVEKRYEELTKKDKGPRVNLKQKGLKRIKEGERRKRPNCRKI